MSCLVVVVVVIVVVVVVVVVLYSTHTHTHKLRAMKAQSAQRLARSWTIDILGFRSRRGLEILSSPLRPDRL
jgi:uncharacterized membrane protein